MTDRDRAIGVNAVIATASAICSGNRVDTFSMLVHAVGRMAAESADPIAVVTSAIDALTFARDQYNAQLNQTEAAS